MRGSSHPLFVYPGKLFRQKILTLYKFHVTKLTQNGETIPVIPKELDKLFRAPLEPIVVRLHVHMPENRNRRNGGMD